MRCITLRDKDECEEDASICYFASLARNHIHVHRDDDEAVYSESISRHEHDMRTDEVPSDDPCSSAMNVLCHCEETLQPHAVSISASTVSQLSGESPNCVNPVSVQPASVPTDSPQEPAVASSGSSNCVNPVSVQPASVPTDSPQEPAVASSGSSISNHCVHKGTTSKLPESMMEGIREMFSIPMSMKDGMLYFVP